MTLRNWWIFKCDNSGYYFKKSPYVLEIHTELLPVIWCAWDLENNPGRQMGHWWISVKSEWHKLIIAEAGCWVQGGSLFPLSFYIFDTFQNEKWFFKKLQTQVQMCKFSQNHKGNENKEAHRPSITATCGWILKRRLMMREMQPLPQNPHLFSFFLFLNIQLFTVFRL